MYLQERTKERLYEEELEVVWEKGGSGLVFYTDSAYWHEQEGGTYALQVTSISRPIAWDNCCYEYRILDT